MIRQAMLVFVATAAILWLLQTSGGLDDLLVQWDQIVQRPESSSSSGKQKHGAVRKVAAPRPPVRKAQAARKKSETASFTILDLNGQTISSASWRGKVTIVNFWATWCPPCREEIPQLISLQYTRGHELQIVGISVDRASPETVRQFALDHRINYPVAMVTPDLRRRFVAVSGLPTSFVLDADGHIIRRHVGMMTIGVYERTIHNLTLGHPISRAN